ncbi:hypothetical protein D6C83_00386 [Aureobasidium pullulans]|uniref:Mitotic-spindle organizing protein 1 n=1 Tax=Aureobasidium pullulans TaxID=5580 RepID=A0A4T0EL84_AURPU|nr:hypothetical protein D6C83_00386 [Aureobasidium pullulans]
MIPPVLFPQLNCLCSSNLSRICRTFFTFNGCQSLHFQKRRPATAKHSISVHPALISHYKHHQNITMPPTEDKRKAARETIDILYEISSLLNTNLDRQSLSYCVSLIENGVNPDALATVLKDLRDRNGVATEPREKP